MNQMRGRKPQPTRLKVLRGNPGQRQLNAREPQIAAAVPDPPDWLGEDAREKWADLVAVLGDLGILTHVDADVLTLYCETWVEWKEATLQIRESGYVVESPKGDLKASPYVMIRSKALQQLRTLEAELGMTPSSRSRVHTVSPARHSNKSKWDGILNV